MFLKRKKHAPLRASGEAPLLRTHMVRLYVVFGAVVFVALCFIVRLYFLQVVNGAEYQAMATEQYTHRASVLFDRGTIFFTQKDGSTVAGATVQRGHILAIDPTRIATLTDASVLYDALAPYTQLSREDFMARATKKNDPYEEIAEKLTEEQAREVRSLRNSAVRTFPHYWRVYPAGTLGAHVLGFLGYDSSGTEKKAQYGIERYWDSVLRRDMANTGMSAFAETFVKEDKGVEGAEEDAHLLLHPGDVVTTIEPSVQSELERVLAQIVTEWGSKTVGGVILDPQTGAMYALAIHPTFDPNIYSNEKDSAVFRNGIVEDVYEMGSIVKPLAMAIGLDEGAVTTRTTYEDTGSVSINGYTIRNYDGKARGVVDMQQVLSQSLNVGMAFVTRKVGGERMAERLLELGIAEETGIDMPAESHGLVENFKNNREVEYITASFGQGIALTPIATVRALASLGNGGMLVTPHIVKEIRYENGEVGNVAPTDTVRVFSEKTSEEITRILVEVVDTALKGGAVKKEAYAIAAKTGTAQIAKKGERGYYDDRYLHSFFGYFPAYNPRFLIFLYHTEPQNVRYASETLTDPFMHLVDFLIHYYEVPPDR